MSHIVSYLKRQRDNSFSDEPFNEVDALILSQFVYLKFDDIIPAISDKKDSIFLYEIANRMDYNKVFADERYNKDNRELFKAMTDSRRYRNMKINYYCNILSVVAETQFAAITCFLEEGPVVVVYRGTDENLVGWKEDFNMFFKEPVMGQELSRLYLNQVCSLTDKPIILAGHSKGGNFAVYAAMNAEEEVQDRIEMVYSFDSPGFRPEILESIDFNKIKPKIIKYLPKASIFGMILQSEENYYVVDCNGVGIGQHIPFTWQVDGITLKRVEELEKRSLLLNETFNEWLYGLSDEELYSFAEVWYRVLRKANVNTLLDFIREPAKSLAGLANALKETDEETKEMVSCLARSLSEVAKEYREKRKKALKEQLEKMVSKRR